MADQTCNMCIEDAYVEISHQFIEYRDDGDGGTDPATAQWFDLPAIKQAANGFTDRTVNEIRHSDSGKAFVKPCGQDARTEVWTITYYPCHDEPMRLYLKHGDTVRVRVHAGKGTELSDVYHEFDAKFVEGSTDFDNSTDDNAEWQFTFEDVANKPTTAVQYWDGAAFVTPTNVVDNTRAQPYSPVP